MFAVFIEPDYRLKKFIKVLKKKVYTNYNNSFFLNHPPHSTIFYSDLKNNKLALSNILKIFKRKLNIKIICKVYSLFTDTPIKGQSTLFIKIKKNKELRIPQDVIFDSLLPYANINERRDAWRKEFFEKFRPLVKDAKSPSEAAAVLNQQVFPMVNVKYSTQRKKADQSPLESMESGLASCTGLSVLLVDACRAVGVPARIVGTPLWSDNSGNHTWVEIWDNGWHFTGACEPTGNALDQGWFIDRASKAIRDERRHAIYAVTFRKNGQNFPMVWARDNTDVFAVNVTDRYTALRSPIPQNHSALRVRVIGPTGARVAVDVRMLDANGNELFRGKSKDDRFDSNDHLTAAVPTGTKVTVSIADTEISQQVEVLEQEQLVELRQP